MAIENGEWIMRGLDWDDPYRKNGWMKNPKSAMLSCNDGFRPVSFLVETLDEDAE